MDLVDAVRDFLCESPRKRHVPFIQNRFHGCGIQFEYLGGGLPSILGLDYSSAICLSFWKGR